MKNDAIELILRKEMGEGYDDLRKKKKVKNRVRAGKLEKREALTGILFILPWIVGMLAFVGYPLVMSVWYSLNNIQIRPTGMALKFVKFGNFTEILLSDPDFPTQIIDYLVETVISAPVIVVFALIIAIMLNGNIKFRGFFRLIFFLPVIVVSGPVMKKLSDQGASTISALDVQAVSSAISSVLPAGIASGITNLFQNMITILWYSGVQILIFLSALQKIDRSMYEAAQIDGGSDWECFWKITLPTIKPMILLNVVYTIVFISGNEQNSIITLIQSVMFSGTKEKGYGYASAMAWVYSLVVLLIIGFFALLFSVQKDPYVRKYKRRVRALKKEQRMAKKIARRNKRHEQWAKREGIY